MKQNYLSPLALAMMVAFSLTGQASASDRVVIQVDNDKKGLVKALAVQLGAQINVDSDGFIAATFNGKDLSEIKGLLKNPHIKLVEEDVKRYPMALFNDTAGDPTSQQLTPYAFFQSQAHQTPFNIGTSPKVCVIDSGIAREVGETGGYNADFEWGSISGSNNSGTGDWYRDGGPHGTHVAGTIGAADNGIGVIGMAPGTAMHIIKVFNDSGWGYSSDLAHAANLCAQNGAKVINMSLGGGRANSIEENAFINFTNNGGLVLAAAGNSGTATRSFPAGYTSVMMVGANDANNQIASFSQFPSCSTGSRRTLVTDEGLCVEVTAGGVDTLSTYPAGGTSFASLTANNNGYSASALENSGSSSGNTYFMGLATTTNTAAAGKICLIDRGTISFHDKVRNCELSGGIGAILINNEPGILYGTLGTSNLTSIPAVGAALEDRTALLASSNASINIGSSDYGYMSGTSMATPAVAGLAARVWSSFPQCTGTDIRNALKATAVRPANGDVVKFGKGIVQAKAAHDYLATHGCAGGNSGGDTGGGDTGGGNTGGGTCKGKKCS